jgi:hypothetical protein
LPDWRKCFRETHLAKKIYKFAAICYF